MPSSFLPQMTQLSFSLVDYVAVLSLNNAPVNALSKTLSDELTAALDIISETPEVRSVILTGEGKIFCAGADLKGRAFIIKGPGDLPAHSRRTRKCFHAIHECTKPVIVALNGPELGGGSHAAALELAKTEDAKEAQRAFLEKRSAVFIGR